MGPRVLARRAAWLLPLLLFGCSDAPVVQLKLIGDACGNAKDCASSQFTCDTAMAGGYCKKNCKGDLDCPAEAVCVFTNDASLGSCYKRCMSGGECRPDSDYVCRDRGPLAIMPTHNFCDERKNAAVDAGVLDMATTD